MAIYIRSAFAVLWIFLAYKWGDWRNWSRYYPTMLFMGMGSLIYTTVFNDKMLWFYNSGHLNEIFSELFIIGTIFSCSVLIFLTHFPKGIFKQIRFILLWVAIYIVIEIAMVNIGMEYLDNGWSIWWSLLHDIYQFPLLAIHHKKPYLAWLISLSILVIMMQIFQIPLITK